MTSHFIRFITAVTPHIDALWGQKKKTIQTWT